MALRGYAAFLHEYLHSEKDGIAINREIARSEANGTLVSLFQVVSAEKGRPMYREVAMLLTGTAEKLGTANYDQKYDLDALKMRLARLRTAGLKRR